MAAMTTHERAFAAAVARVSLLADVLTGTDQLRRVARKADSEADNLLFMLNEVFDEVDAEEWVAEEHDKLRAEGLL